MEKTGATWSSATISRRPLASLVSVNAMLGGVTADGDTVRASAIRAAAVASRPVSLRIIGASCVGHLTPVLTLYCLLCQHSRHGVARCREPRRIRAHGAPGDHAARR